jgi:CubicO group peptidase (beta-lactamase class C family)
MRHLILAMIVGVTTVMMAGGAPDAAGRQAAAPQLEASQPPASPTPTPDVAVTPAPPPSPSSTASLDDHAALAAWFDGTVNALLDAHHVAGAVITIVRNGEVILSRGYGYADVASRTHVDPAATLFRVGSVSKLFVWISVMQLLEQGKLDLKADVNTYLKDLQIPAAYGQPITMQHLMTHTAGFDDRVVGLFSHHPSQVKPLGVLLREQMPARVSAPGKYASYSNYGAALAMHVVEQISGESWDHYVQTHIITPLGLQHTFLAQPLPPDAAPHVSKGYLYQNQVFVRQDFEIIPMAPVGGISATADDMAALMEMFLNGGEYHGARILSESTVRTMESDLLTMAPGVSAQAHGMMDMSRPGLRIVGHGGDTLWFHSDLALLPEHDLGVFVSFNTNTGSDAREAFMRTFIERYFQPTRPARPTPPPDFASRAPRYTGFYRGNRFPHHGFTRIMSALQPVTVTSDGRGALLFSIFGDRRFIEVAPDTFRYEDGSDVVVFLPDQNGAINHFVPGGVGVVAFERVATSELPMLHLALGAATMVVCVLAILGWLFAPVVRWKHAVTGAQRKMLPPGMRVVGWITCALVLAFVVGFVMSLGDPQQVVFGVPKVLTILLMLPLAIAVLVALMVLLTLFAWTRSSGTVPARIGYTLVTLLLCAFVWQTVVWNLTALQN